MRITDASAGVLDAGCLRFPLQVNLYIALHVRAHTLSLAVHSLFVIGDEGETQAGNVIQLGRI